MRAKVEGLLKERVLIAASSVICTKLKAIRTLIKFRTMLQVACIKSRHFDDTIATLSLLDLGVAQCKADDYSKVSGRNVIEFRSGHSGIVLASILRRRPDGSSSARFPKISVENDNTDRSLCNKARVWRV